MCRYARLNPIRNQGTCQIMGVPIPNPPEGSNSTFVGLTPTGRLKLMQPVDGPTTVLKIPLRKLVQPATESKPALYDCRLEPMRLTMAFASPCMCFPPAGAMVSLTATNRLPALGAEKELAGVAGSITATSVTAAAEPCPPLTVSVDPTCATGGRVVGGTVVVATVVGAVVLLVVAVAAALGAAVVGLAALTCAAFLVPLLSAAPRAAIRKSSPTGTPTTIQGQRLRFRRGGCGWIYGGSGWGV